MNLADPRALVDYTRTLDCIHCGLCLRTCPTYQLTGVETSSPRGRIHLMRAVAEGQLAPDADFADEMDFCLLCRHCESACPAGVHFSELMEHTRSALRDSPALRPGPLARAARWIGFALVLPRPWLLSALASALRLAQQSGLWKPLTRLAGRRGRALEHFPRVPPRRARARLPARTPARTPARAPGQPAREPVLLLEGCVMPELYGATNRATVAALSELGCEVRVPRGQRCCGSLHAHNGERALARELARANIEAFERAGASFEIATNSAGCGSHLRALEQLFDEGDPWRARAAAFAARVRDFSELAAPLARTASLAAGSSATQLDALARELPQPLGPLTWDDPCHLCHGQQIRAQPRQLLDWACGALGLERVELRESESCCGSAGIYSVLRPEASAAIFAPKLEALRASGARTLVTANPGCQLQWQTGLRAAGLEVRVLHLAELSALALRARSSRAV
jgi:glycolate oxidase iron-sulfur subunit